MSNILHHKKSSSKNWNTYKIVHLFISSDHNYTVFFKSQQHTSSRFIIHYSSSRSLCPSTKTKQLLLGEQQKANVTKTLRRRPNEPNKGMLHQQRSGSYSWERQLKRCMYLLLYYKTRVGCKTSTIVQRYIDSPLESSFTTSNYLNLLSLSSIFTSLILASRFFIKPDSRSNFQFSFPYARNH